MSDTKHRQIGQATEIYPWPSLENFAVKTLSTQGWMVISVETMPSAARDIARQKIRSAVKATLARACSCSLDEVQIKPEAGQAPGVIVPGHHFYLSISHEPGLSLAAVSMLSSVGVDLMQVDSTLDWRPPAELYLAPVVTKAISALPPSKQAFAFALAWTELEARLKCRHLAISEWSPSLQQQLSLCRVQRLTLPAVSAVVATIAFAKQD